MIVPAGTFGAVWPICPRAPVTLQTASANTTTTRLVIIVLQFVGIAPANSHRAATSLPDSSFQRHKPTVHSTQKIATSRPPFRRNSLPPDIKGKHPKEFSGLYEAAHPASVPVCADS